MAKIEELPFLLKLFDDDSPTVRETVLGELALFGTSLNDELARLDEPPDEDTRQRLMDLLDDFRLTQGIDDDIQVLAADGEPLFSPGQLIIHNRYGYRGVVVDVDITCQADDLWYHSNQTQPDRDQPWYHILVDESDQVTYAAQSSLTADPSESRVDHPLIPYFFTKYEDGRYIRNNQPWPDQSKF